MLELGYIKLNYWVIGLKLKKGKSFSEWVINLQNSLPQEVMEASSLTQFKRGLDKFLEEGPSAGGRGARLETVDALVILSLSMDIWLDGPMVWPSKQQFLCSHFFWDPKDWNTQNWPAWACYDLQVMSQGF